MAVGVYPQSTERIVMQADLEALTYVKRAIKAATVELQSEVAHLTRERDAAREELAKALEQLDKALKATEKLVWVTRERDEARAALAAERKGQRAAAIPAQMYDEGRAAGDLLRR